MSTLTSLIRVNSDTKNGLDLLKIHPREPYGDVIDRILGHYLDDGPIDEEGLKEGLEDWKAGRVRSLEEVMKEIREEQEHAKVSGSDHQEG